MQPQSYVSICLIIFLKKKKNLPVVNSVALLISRKRKILLNFKSSLSVTKDYVLDYQEIL